jgi:hypothetical protein
MMMAESKKKHATVAIECAESSLTHLDAAQQYGQTVQAISKGLNRVELRTIKRSLEI